MEQAVNEAQEGRIGTLLVVDKDKPDKLVGGHDPRYLEAGRLEVLKQGCPGGPQVDMQNPG